jgi:multiple sugar transport system ATP-binding protein
MNLFECRLVNGEADLAGNPISLPVAAAKATAADSLDRLVVGIRPEDITVVAEGQGIPAIVELVEELGADAFLHARVSDRSRDDVLTVRTDAKRPPRRGDRLALRLETDHMHIFDQAGERLEIP